MTRLFALFMTLVVAAAVSAQTEGTLVPGVSVRMYDIGRPMGDIRPLVAGQTPNVSRIEPRIDFRNEDFAPMEEFFILHAEGWIVAAEAGRYAFELTSDDGSELWINGERVIDHDGLHGPEALTGEADLSEGLNAFEVRYFNGPTGRQLTLKWRLPGWGGGFSVIPTESYRCHGGEVRVTSPGRKEIIRPLRRGRPGDGQPLNAVHPSFTLTSVRPDGFEPRVGGMDMLPDGRLVLCTWDPEGAVYVLDGVGGDGPEDVTVKRIAAGLAEPLGLQVVDGEIYVLQKQELTHLIDDDGDDVIDEYRSVCSGWPVSSNFHEFAFGLVHKDGLFYANLAIAIDPGGRSTDPQIPERGTVIAIDPVTGTYEIVAHGLRTPNGIGLGPDGEIYLTDNQGDWVPVSKVLKLEEGAFYGSHAVLGAAAGEFQVTPPVVWLPQGEIGNSPSNPQPLDVGPYRGQMVHGDVTHGGLKRVFMEEIDGMLQGAVFRFSQGFEGGVNRVLRADRGRFFVGGIGSSGNWGQEGKAKYGLQRLDFNGEPTFEMLAVRAMANGFELEFTQPLAAHVGWNPEEVIVEQFRYEPTAAYGGPKLDRERLEVTSSSVFGDRRVFVEIDGLKAGHVQHIRLVGPWRGVAEDDPDRTLTLWSTEAWYTMNAIPSDRSMQPMPRAIADAMAAAPKNVLSRVERDAGWRLLFDGRTLDGWRGYRRDDVPEGWVVEDGAIHRNASGGDLLTERAYDDFELAFEWKISSGGNSGVFFNVTEDNQYVWESGPEMQVLDNEGHANGVDPMTSAGANYALHAPTFDPSYPAGVWNRARLYVRGDHVEHWLNGHKIVSYDLGSDDWERRVAASKFSTMPGYGRAEAGHIALQDHGDLVWFRNIRIREID